MERSTSREEAGIVPRWGRGTALFLAVGLLVFALHRYLAGFDRHVFYVSYIAEEFATVQMPVIRSHPLSEHLHRLGGSLLVLAGLLQFSERLRRRRPALHRAVGRVYVALALLAACSGIYMGTAHPFGGIREAIPSVVFGAALIAVTTVALALVLRRRFAAHREWMIRSYAIALGPMMVRIVYVPLWMVVGIPERETVGISFWLGWLINLAIAEAWIRRSAPVTAARGSRSA